MAYEQARMVERLELNQQQRQQILRLASNLPVLWHSVTTTAAERKEMLGLLVKQVALFPLENPTRQTRIAILWHTGATTELMVPRPTSREKLSTPTQVIEAIRELTPNRTYGEMAELLNQRGFVTGFGRKFTASAVNWICWKFQIKKPTSVDPKGPRPDGCYSTKALADQLGVSIYTIHALARKGCTFCPSRI